MKKIRIIVVTITLFALIISFLCIGSYNLFHQTTWSEQYYTEYYKGIEYLQAGDYEKAIQAFSRAIEIDSSNYQTYVRRGDAYMLLDESHAALERAKEDYMAALAIDHSHEEVYHKLYNVYNAIGDIEGGIEVLYAGIDQTNSQGLGIAVRQAEAASFSDEDLVEIANLAVDDTYAFLEGVNLGSYFQQDWVSPIRDANGELLFLVIDERVKSIDDIEALWNETFSQAFPMPDLEHYREIDGHLYSENQGVGSDITLLERKLVSVQSRSATSATLIGYELRLNMYTREEYQNLFTYEMDYEAGKWKCAGFESGDVIKDAIPSQDEIYPEMFDETYWHWNTSPGNGGNYYALFHADGTFSYIRVTTLESSIGTYEYDGTTLFLNGIEYVGDFSGFYSKTDYSVMGAPSWKFTLTPDSEKLFEKYTAQELPYESSPDSQGQSDSSQSSTPVLKDTPSGAREIANRIASGVIGYSIDLLDAFVDTVTPKDAKTLLQSVLSYKETIKNMISMELIGEIEDKAIVSQMLELYNNSGMGTQLSDDDIYLAEELISEALRDQPNLARPMLKICITKSPGIVLYLATTATGGKLLPLSLVVNVFEASADAYWGFGEAIASYRNVLGSHADSIVNHCNDFLSLHYKNLELVAMSAYKDSRAGTVEQLETIRQVSLTYENSKALLIRTINECLTLHFRIFHPIRTQKLENLLDQLFSTNVNYEQYYWDLVNGLTS